jgi:hypothetical protein
MKQKPWHSCKTGDHQFSTFIRLQLIQVEHSITFHFETQQPFCQIPERPNGTLSVSSVKNLTYGAKHHFFSGTVSCHLVVDTYPIYVFWH